jgi:hypothetical protein
MVLPCAILLRLLQLVKRDRRSLLLLLLLLLLLQLEHRVLTIELKLLGKIVGRAGLAELCSREFQAVDLGCQSLIQCCSRRQ